MNNQTSDIKLTQFSHGAGCGCKIAPAVLDQILKTDLKDHYEKLLVGYDYKDDAAVLDIGDGRALISTTDFFMPIVDDAFDFGKIASVNAISDIYAMGGHPVMAIGILGWPIDKIPAELAARVIDGARTVCREAGIPLAGGHSIDSPEPIFGLSVNGLIQIQHLKTNKGAKENDLLYLTKPLGVGILTTAEKKGLVSEEDLELAKQSMFRLNNIGASLGKLSYVHSITDVTGFGLAGHLLEMCEASELDAVLHYVNLPLLTDSIAGYIQKGAIPGGTLRNWKSYGTRIHLADPEWFKIVADPQTSGGLLIAVEESSRIEFEKHMQNEHCYFRCIGSLNKKEASGAEQGTGIRIHIA